MVNWQAYNCNVIFVTFVLVLGSSFQFGFNIGSLNLLSEFITDFFVEKEMSTSGTIYDATSPVILTYWQLTTALFIPGGVIGASLAGFMMDRIGRKCGIVLSHVFIGIGVALMVLCRATDAPAMLMVGRIFVGVNSGFGNTIVPTFVSEYAMPEARGALGTMHQLFITFGILVGNIFGMRELLGGADRWQYVFVVMIPPIIVSCCCLPFIPESPRYMLLVKHNEMGGKAALKYYRRSSNVDAEYSAIIEEGKQDALRQKVHFTFIQLFTDPELRRPTIITCSLQIVQQFSGINAVMFYSTGIFKHAGVPGEQIQYAVVGTSAVNMAMTVIAVPLMEIAGRRKLLLIPMAVMIVDFAVLTIAMVYADTSTGWGTLAIACVIVYVISFAVGLGPIPMMIGSEMFRQEPRPMAMMVGGWTNWLFTFIVAMTFEHVQKACHPYTFIIFIALLIVFLFFCIIFVPETRNKTFEEIAKELGLPMKVEGMSLSKSA